MPDNKIMNELNGLHIAVLILSGLITLLLMLYLFRTRSPPASTSSKRKKKPDLKEQSISQQTKPCPLCKEPLNPGERVHSILYPGKPDSLMEIFGCPFCEKPDSKNKRTCPVCKKEMPSDAMLIARVFEKPGKKHVHVLGCSSCYSGRSRTRKN